MLNPVEPVCHLCGWRNSDSAESSASMIGGGKKNGGTDSRRAAQVANLCYTLRPNFFSSSA